MARFGIEMDIVCEHCQKRNRIWLEPVEKGGTVKILGTGDHRYHDRKIKCGDCGTMILLSDCRHEEIKVRWK